MGKLFVRIDDRLIHGQIVTAWALNLGIKKIIAVDDTLASNPMLKTIMTMAAPKEYDPEIISASEAKELLSKNADKNVLLITRQCRNLKPFLEDIKGAEHINLGNISTQNGTVKVLDSGSGRTLSLTQEDVDTLDEAVTLGINVISQLLPSEKQYQYSDLKSK
jgi:mannose/fructose/N-acetylgalactosamine-specific phosphotransferase system component IIB